MYVKSERSFCRIPSLVPAFQMFVVVILLHYSVCSSFHSSASSLYMYIEQLFMFLKGFMTSVFSFVIIHFDQNKMGFGTYF